MYKRNRHTETMQRLNSLSISLLDRGEAFHLEIGLVIWSLPRGFSIRMDTLDRWRRQSARVGDGLHPIYLLEGQLGSFAQWPENQRVLHKWT